MHALIAFCCLVAVLAAGVPDAEGCSCARQGPACEDYWSTAVVFRGRVESIGPVQTADETLEKFRTIRFTVLESFKGVSVSSVEVRTAVGGATCGYRFAGGREYLVYAAVDASGALATSVCTRTRPVAKAQADLDHARGIATGGVPLGRIGGRVVLQTRDLVTGRNRARPIREAAVTIRGGEFSAPARTNPAGEFAVTGLDPGPYTVGLELDGSFRVEIAPDPVVLRDPRACAAIEAKVYPDGRVSGRVLDSNREPVRGITVDLTVPDTPRLESSGYGPNRLRAVTLDDGTYELTGVPPGRFVLGISAGESGGDLAAYYPGVLHRFDAVTVVVPAGGRVSLDDLEIPASVPLQEISGVVFDTGQTPVEGARVYLRGPAERDFILTEAVVTDASGRFTIAAIEQEYVLFAERDRSGVPHGIDSTDLLRISPSSSGAPVRLTLRRRY
jgi:hypothetical protein